ncbi:transcriptional regulator [Paraburkholderia phymatum]|uniref:Regulatory protein MerR n=1 Tax=Paraburkholderia phymatum (strain DSM 17167 / CIP 108236 / LMG 21445 / STM815) TaxID=391038 RepID=B2JU63_PARP8|nr:MerR family transcriptional regulator [Paraburkholderia phymatum]ACC76116.1 regulatory protein MerR [Paraburkholderia phymatum STM815]
MSPTNEADDEHSPRESPTSVEGLLTAADLAARLGLTLATVRRYASMPGKLPPRVTWTRKQRWHPHTVDEWAKAQDGLTTFDEQMRKAREAGAAKAVERARRVPRLGRPRGKRQKVA